jgi:hypothetical protein
MFRPMKIHHHEVSCIKQALWYKVMVKHQCVLYTRRNRYTVVLWLGELVAAKHDTDQVPAFIVSSSDLLLSSHMVILLNNIWFGKCSSTVLYRVNG